jgi:hypothetical protein
MASHDTQFHNLRATSQDNAARVQTLNEALRKLKERIDREHSNKNRVDESSVPKPKS